MRIEKVSFGQWDALLYGWAAYARTLPTERQCRRGPGEHNLLAVPQGSQCRGAHLLIAKSISFNLRVTWTLWVAGIDPGEKS